ncbi:MAG TPA: hypothetical protein VMR31_05990 [Myxococcota bacterium]|nr:hypothetical protein [Myxococcota bacterium]
MPRKRLAAAFAALHWAALALVWGRFAEVAALRFPTDWDFLAYHFPGALAAYGLTTYTPEPRLAAVIQGFPPLPRAIEGGLVLLTGRFSAACLLNLIGVGGLVAGSYWLYGRSFSVRWFLTCLLGIPLVVLHAISGYVDLFTACGVALALASLGGLEAGAARPRATAVLLVASLTAAQLSKFQAWPIAALVAGFALWRLAALARGGVVSRRAALGLVAALALGLGAWPIRNLVQFHNPVYPVVFPLAPRLFPNAVVDADSGIYNMPSWLADEPRPVRFVASALELNRFFDGDRFAWTLDQSAQADPVRSPHHRMGGWFWWTFLALSFGAARALRAGLVPRAALAAFAPAVLAVAVLPQSHELRYWLFIPLLLAVATARALAAPELGSQRGMRAALVLAAAVVLVVVHPFAYDARAPAELAPEAAKAFWAAQRAAPKPEPVRVCNVNPNGIFWAGPDFREFRVEACFGDP